MVPVPAAVGLLKVDVEGAELGVLRGIGAVWWQRIERVVVEVHDVGDRRRDVSFFFQGGANNRGTYGYAFRQAARQRSILFVHV